MFKMDPISDHNNGLQERQKINAGGIDKAESCSHSRERNISGGESVADLPNSSPVLSTPLHQTSIPSAVVTHCKNCFDELSLSITSSSSEFDLPDDFEMTTKENNSNKHAHFFLDHHSSRLSISSEEDDDDDEDDFPSLLELILSDTSLDDLALYNDWDSGLSHSSGELQREDSGFWRNHNTPDLEIGRLDFPHRALRYMECEICLEMSYLRRRVCCDFQSCNKCLSMYLSGKVKEGKVQIECLNDRCHVLMNRAEIRHRLSIEMREKFEKFLIDANKDPHVKTCPSCSVPFKIDPAKLKVSKKKLKRGIEVTCTQCRLVWCFRCQAPFHSNMTCKKYKNGDEMLKRWAKEISYGQANAQKCPKCKIFVQKVDGCDHMKCSQCDTNFCYRCGDRYISVKFFGSHWNRFSLFGCKYRLMPEKTGLRRFIRGAHFVGRLLGAVVFAALGVAAGAVLIAGSGIVLPGYGILVLRRRMVAAKKRRMFNRIKLRMIDEAEKSRAEAEQKFQGILETVIEESETETSDPIPDPQQVQVMVHRPEGQEDATANQVSASADCSVIVNNYTDDSSAPNALQSSVKKVNSADTGDDDILYEEVYSYVVHDVKKNSESYIVSPTCLAVSDHEEDDEGCGFDGVKGEYLDMNSDKKSCNMGNKAVSVTESARDEATKVHVSKWDNSDSNSLQDCSKSDKDEMTLLSLAKKSEPKLHENEEGTSLAGDGSFVSGQRKQSLSKIRTSSEEKVVAAKTKVLKDADKALASEKTDGDASGKGCFGNIFNVAKRSTGVNQVGNNAVNEDGVVKLDKPTKQKNGFLVTKKADTWEKCRRSKVEIDSGLKSSIDSISDCDCNHIPLLHKSPSSLSSIIGFNFSMDDSFVKKDINIDCPIRKDEGIELDNNVYGDLTNEGSTIALEQGVSQATIVTHL